MMLMATLDGRLTSRLAFVDKQMTTAAKFCLFFLVVPPQNHQNRRYFWDMHVNNASSRDTKQHNAKNQRHGRRQAVIVATS